MLLKLSALEIREVPTANVPEPAMVTVALPDGYSQDSASVRYPVVYLLNGHGGDHRSWSYVINLDSLATAYGMIIVCPAGLNSWYWDAPADSTLKMESYVTEDLVPWVDSNYRTVADRAGRAITGLSMGGMAACGLDCGMPICSVTRGRRAVVSISVLSRRNGTWPTAWGRMPAMSGCGMSIR